MHKHCSTAGGICQSGSCRRRGIGSPQHGNEGCGGNKYGHSQGGDLELFHGLSARFAPLFRQEAGLCLRESAAATAAPGEFLLALVFTALTEGA